MKITDVSVIVHRLDVPESVRATGWPPKPSYQFGTLTVATDEGIEGHVMLGDVVGTDGGDEGAEIMKKIKPLILGQDPLQVGAIWSTLWRTSRAQPRTIGAVDIAIWDIVGKKAGLPIHQLLGSYREKVPVYASLALFTVENSVDMVQDLRNRGWQGFKIFARQGADKDIEKIFAAKKAAGDDMVLMYDAGGRYEYDDALKVGQVLEELGFYWFEDPLAWDNIYGYVKLKSKLAIHILATEGAPGSFYGMAPWIMERATDSLRGDTAIKGGLTPLIKIAHTAETFRMPFQIHDAITSSDHVANLHVTMAVPHCPWFEVHTRAYRDYGLAEYPLIDNEGFIHAPTRPGLGFPIDWDLVNRTKIGELR